MQKQHIYSGKIISVHKDDVRLPNGKSSLREVVELDDAVAIIAITEEQKILLIRQYRYPVGKSLWEIPAGKIEQHEQPLECAKRELEEETGYTASKWRPLGHFYTSPGFCNEKIFLFQARGLKKTQPHLDPGEFITTHKIPLIQAMDMLTKGGIQDAKTIIGLLTVAGNHHDYNDG